ncbi:hypothetical protein HPP92_000461 [Vanilla planifolia]|uniref:Exopolygalacturonase n=1 Tax=Vanilla planifolia TaxID=51239 RepID=A0A835RNV7_VANPL|nr:hypothetical protein HPP92_000461 [Vanilla planifolia]
MVNASKRQLFSFLLLLSVSPACPAVVSVRQFGARADGHSNDTKAFLEAWKAACGSTGNVKLDVPEGTYLVGPIKFMGPCKNVSSLTVQIKASRRMGVLKATTNLDEYSTAVWIKFGGVHGLSLLGGTFDGQGAVSWPFNKCPKQKNCRNLMFVNTTNTVVRGVTSLNSKFFHIGILGCTNLKGSDIKISAPANSPNTDGIHLERNSGVSLSRLTVGSGDDCVSVGQGNSDITLTGVRCGPGHGISVGSLGRYKGEGDVRGMLVKDCTIVGTTNGVRIKTWQNSPSSSVVTNLTFDNIVMKNVRNPILIDQEYCPYTKCDSSAPSLVKISNIKFKNIRGTSASPEVVTLRCSKGLPCKAVTLQDVKLKYVGDSISTTYSTCLNVKPVISGSPELLPCGDSTQ